MEEKKSLKAEYNLRRSMLQKTSTRLLTELGEVATTSERTL